MSFKSIKFGRSQSDTLAVTGASEFLSRQAALSENIVILEELKNSNAVFLDYLLDLSHECLVIIHTIKVRKSVSESGLGACSVAIDYVFKAVGITKEVCIPDRVILVAINKRDSFNLLLINLEAKCVENLSENLRSHLEGAKGISVLEETLGIESVLPDDFTEVSDDLFADSGMLSGGLSSAIGGGSASFANNSVEVLVKTLLGKDFVNSV